MCLCQFVCFPTSVLRLLSMVLLCSWCLCICSSCSLPSCFCSSANSFILVCTSFGYFISLYSFGFSPACFVSDVSCSLRLLDLDFWLQLMLLKILFLFLNLTVMSAFEPSSFYKSLQKRTTINAFLNITNTTNWLFVLEEIWLKSYHPIIFMSLMWNG